MVLPGRAENLDTLSVQVFPQSPSADVISSTHELRATSGVVQTESGSKSPGGVVIGEWIYCKPQFKKNPDSKFHRQFARV